jgi:hypothetical protein
MHKKVNRYKVTYSHTRASDKYYTKAAALGQARWAVDVGNTRSCVHKRTPHGWVQIKCVTRKKRKR